MRLGHTFQSGNPNLIPEHPDSTSPKARWKTTVKKVDTLSLKAYVVA